MMRDRPASAHDRRPRHLTGAPLCVYPLHMTNTYNPGDRVTWITGHITATVVRIGHGGEYVIRPDGDPGVYTTRACFMMPA